jgi:hypothetical protein
MRTPKAAAVVVLSLLAAGLALFHRRTDPERVQVTAVEEQHPLDAMPTAMPTRMAAEDDGSREKEHHELMRLRDEVGRPRREGSEITNGPVCPLDLPNNVKLDSILQVLRDNDAGQEADSRRIKAAEELRTLGASAVSVLPQLQQLLGSGNQAPRDFPTHRLRICLHGSIRSSAPLLHSSFHGSFRSCTVAVGDYGLVIHSDPLADAAPTVIAQPVIRSITAGSLFRQFPHPCPDPGIELSVDARLI